MHWSWPCIGLALHTDGRLLPISNSRALASRAARASEAMQVATAPSASLATPADEGARYLQAIRAAPPPSSAPLGAGSGDPGGHLGAALGRRGQRHVERAHRADMDVEIDPVEQGAEQARLIIADTARVLVAVPRRIAGIAAAARVHCSDQLDATCFARKLKKLIGVGRRNVRFTHRRDNSAIQQSTPIRTFRLDSNFRKKGKARNYI